MPKTVTIAGEKFNFFTKEEWGSRVTSPPEDPLSDGPEPQVYLHHEGAKDPNKPTITRPLTIAEEMARMRAWQDFCIDRAGQGWTDIPYNVGIFPFSGNVYEARGLRYKSGATLGQNEDSKAFCIIGNISKDAPGIPPALNSAALAIVWAMELKEVHMLPKSVVLGHRENPKHLNATPCPGYVDLDAFRSLVKKKFDLHFAKPIVVSPPKIVGAIPDIVKVTDVAFVIAAPEGANARFLATSDSRGFIGSMAWIDNEVDYRRLIGYYPEVKIEANAPKNIALIGPLPKGDTLRNWTWDDFLNAPPS